MIEKSEIIIGGLHLPLYSLDTLVIGSGAAGFNALDWLYDFGRRDIAMITEGINAGTSRNTGSDKQTDYKVSIE
jgi:succinate dehydrogenase/fumarate reductase flavoprotein subunit